MHQNKPLRGNRSWKSLLLGVAAAAAVMGCATAITALLMTNGDVPLDSAALVSRLEYAFAAAVGSFTASRLAKSAKLIWALSAVAFFTVGLLALLLILAGESGSSISAVLPIGAGAVLAGALLGAKMKRISYV